MLAHMGSRTQSFTCASHQVVRSGIDYGEWFIGGGMHLYRVGFRAQGIYSLTI